jgi:hypothetical protein
MRNYCFAAAVFLVLIFAGCMNSKDGFLYFGFSVDYNLPELTLPGDPLLSLLPPQPLPDIPVDMNADSEFNTQYFDHIVRIKLRQLVFTITADSTNPLIDTKEPVVPTPDDWSFLTSAEIWVEHPVTSEQALIAYVAAGDPQLSSGSNMLHFNCLQSNMVDYFDDNYNTILLFKTVGTFPPDDVIFQGRSEFDLSAALIK